MALVSIRRSIRASRFRSDCCPKGVPSESRRGLPAAGLLCGLSGFLGSGRGLGGGDAGEYLLHDRVVTVLALGLDQPGRRIGEHCVVAPAREQFVLPRGRLLVQVPDPAHDLPLMTSRRTTSTRTRSPGSATTSLPGRPRDSRRAGTLASRGCFRECGLRRAHGIGRLRITSLGSCCPRCG
jgi:hypothetical protein